MITHKQSPFQQIARRVDSHAKLLHVGALTGGSAAQVNALEIRFSDGHTEKLVVRQHGAVDLAINPHVAADEFALLSRLQKHGIAAPKPYFVDESGEILPTPYLVVSFVEGSTADYPESTADFVEQVVAQLRRIHTADSADFSFLAHTADHVAHKLQNPPSHFDLELQEEHVRALLAVRTTEGECRLLHGDFWAGNLLWKEGKLAAVIDWEDAALGDPLADVANARLELLWKFGKNMMSAFTDHFHAHMPFDSSHLAYWDLFAALHPAHKLGGWGLDPLTHRRMVEQHRWFVEQAEQALQR